MYVCVLINFKIKRVSYCVNLNDWIEEYEISSGSKIEGLFNKLVRLN